MTKVTKVTVDFGPKVQRDDELQTTQSRRQADDKQTQRRRNADAAQTQRSRNADAAQTQRRGKPLTPQRNADESNDTSALRSHSTLQRLNADESQPPQL